MASQWDDITMTLTRDEAREIQRRRDFIARNTAAGTTWQMKKDLELAAIYYDTDLPRETPFEIISQDELPERHRLMLSLQTKIRQFTGEAEWMFNRQQISKMLCMQMNELVFLEMQGTETEWEDDLDDFLDAVLCPERVAQDQATHRSQQTGSSSASSQKTARSQKARDQVADLAGQQCVFTSLAIFDICHFLPFAANNSLGSLTETVRLLGAMKPFYTAAEYYTLVKVIKENVGATDRPWNMIALNNSMHRQWSKTYFVLVWRGWVLNKQDNSLADVTLQLRNLPRDKRNPRATIPIGDTPQKLLDSLLHGWPKVPDTNQFDTEWRDDDHASVTHHPSQRRILSGTTTTFPVELKHVEKMKLMVDLLFLCTKLRVLSGAAEPREDYSPPPGPPPLMNQQTVHRVEHWLYTLPDSEKLYGP